MSAVGQRLVRAALILLVGCGLVSCSADSIEAVELNGPGTLGLSLSGQSIKGVVVYFHGMDEGAEAIREGDQHEAFFEPLLRAGYAVVAADAGGNAFGNPDSRADYRKLIATAQAKYTAEPLFFVAESMGGLPALALISEDTDRRVKGMVGITPLMGIPRDIRSVDFIANVWGGAVPDSADPLAWPPEVFANRTFRLYTSPDDQVIPAAASARAFADRFGSVATVELIDCVGGHVAAACYDGPGVLAWMATLRD